MKQYFGPGVLHAPPVVADEAKLAILLVQACLRAPPEAKLAIVFTYFFLSFFLFSCFFVLRLLLFTHFGDTQEANFFLALIFCHN